MDSQNPSDPQTTYEIRLAGRLGPGLTRAFPEFAVTHTTTAGVPQTVLCAALPDQAALFGALQRVRDFGLHLVAVNEIHST